MASRTRAVFALCLAIAVAVPIPAAAVAGQPPAADSGHLKASTPTATGKSDGPTRGLAKGRPSDPFAAGARGSRRVTTPTVLRPNLDTLGHDPGPASAPKPRTALATPSSAFFLDGIGAGFNPGSGILKLYTEADTSITLTTDSPGGVSLAIQENPFPSKDWWYLDLYAADGDTLVPGTYEGATRYPFNAGDEPGLSFSGNGVGCNTLTGRFTIHELTRGAGGELTSLSASFEHHCEGAPPAVYGDIRFESSMGLQAYTVDPVTISFGQVLVGQPVTQDVHVQNVGTTALGLSAISITGPDAAKFDLDDAACPATLSAGASCDLIVGFQPDAVGSREATLTIDDDTARGAHAFPIAGEGIPPSIAGSTGRAPAELVSLGSGITDARHEDFYTCSATPCIEPPDPAVAVGPDHVVQSAGGLIRITNRLGGQPLTADIGSWFAQPDDIDGFTDATVAYDAGTDHWFGASTSWYCGADPVGFLDVGISATSDPTGEWWIYSWYFEDTLPSSPLIGLTSDKVSVAHQEVDLAQVCAGNPSPSMLGSDLLVVDTDDWVKIPNQLAFWYSGLLSIAAWRPANSPTSQDSALHLIGALYGPTSFNIAYYTLVGHVTPFTIDWETAADLTANGLVPATSPAGPPVDPGGPIDEGSNALPGAAAYRNGRLAFAVDHPCTPAGDTTERVCVRVVELTTPPNALPTVRQDVVIGQKGANLFQSGVAYGMAGDLHIVSAIASGTRKIGVRHVYQRSDDAAGKFSSAVSVVTGQAAYGGEAWGDVVVLAQDPVDAFAIWQGDEYATADGRWGTRISQIRLPGATYTPIEPTRLLDSRFGNGLSGTFLSGTPRTFQITGRGGIPAKAIAVTGNVTVTAQTSAGYLALTPTPTAFPTTSTINFPVGDTRANNVTLSLGAGGKLSAVFKGAAGARTHLIFDVTGYFVRDNNGSTYVSLPPVRLLDTRFDNGLSGTFKAGTPRSVQITGRGDVPAGAKAISANLTVVGQTGAGYVTLSPVSTADPATSTINFPVGDTRANGVTVPLSPTGKVSAVYKAPPGKVTHLILDVTGYYVADASGSRYVPLNPARTLDTRFNVGLSGTFKASTPRTLKIDGRRGIPDDAVAIAGNLTIVGQTGGGYVAITTVPTATPTTSVLNAPVGDVRANGVTVPIAASGTDSLVYVASAGKVSHLILDVTGYFR